MTVRYGRRWSQPKLVAVPLVRADTRRSNVTRIDAIACADLATGGVRLRRVRCVVSSMRYLTTSDPEVQRMQRVIPLHTESNSPPASAQPADPSNRLEAIAAIPVTRRRFLGGTAVLTGSLALGGTLALIAPSRSWAVELSVFDDAMAAKLVKFTQVIFPHKDMPEAINALAVKDLDAKAAEDDTVLAAFEEGFAALDEASGGDFMAADAEAQLKAVTANTDSALFQTVRGQCVTSLYDNELAWQHFGYEGEAFAKGGYLTRGFDDLSWLPDPPIWASPRVEGV